MKEIKLTPKRKEALESLGLYCVSDLLQYYPYRYEKNVALPMSEWKVNERVVFEGILIHKPTLYRYRGNNCIVYLDIETEYAVLKVSFFNQIWYQKKQAGQRLTIIGRYEGGRKVLGMSASDEPLSSVTGLKPVYSLKDRLKPKDFQKLVAMALETNRNEIKDLIPASIRANNGYLNRYEAVKELHFPTSEKSLAAALNTLKYEEFLKFHCLMLERRKDNKMAGEGYRKHIDQEKLQKLVSSMPFTLTKGQQSAVNDILKDMSSENQMCRLLQGDVGCGKTVVAFIAMYAACLNNQQAVLMAPTEILAKQHYANAMRFFKGFDLNIELLYSGLSSSQRNEILRKMVTGETDIIIGTHAVFQQDVNYHDLGLIVTDEQHRFGVKQRQALQNKGTRADLLLMSATPIPRTLATTLYGDMDVSTIEETPNKGKIIHTRLLKENSFISVIDEIENLLKDNQMYVICASIEKGIDPHVRNVNDIYLNLRKYFGGRYTVGLLHGQMSEEEKDQVQEDFAAGKIHILVSTTVVEVGVDVHKANIMVIYDANRFGLSQLHQLRGRIGRGENEGHCYLLTAANDEEALSKLKIIERNTDGFKIAYYDLKLRGPGDILGYRQSGLPEFRLANIINDPELLNLARKDAVNIVNNLDAAENEGIREYLLDNADNAQVFPD